VQHACALKLLDLSLVHSASGSVKALVSEIHVRP
jgi:hypothetical protein